MGTVPQSHEKHIRQTNRPQVASLLPAKPDFFCGFGFTPHSPLSTPHYFHTNPYDPLQQVTNTNENSIKPEARSFLRAPSSEHRAIFIYLLR
jgi:hypothetical protein